MVVQRQRWIEVWKFYKDLECCVICTTAWFLMIDSSMYKLIHPFSCGQGVCAHAVVGFTRRSLVQTSTWSLPREALTCSFSMIEPTGLWGAHHGLPSINQSSLAYSPYQPGIAIVTILTSCEPTASHGQPRPATVHIVFLCSSRIASPSAKGSRPASTGRSSFSISTKERVKGYWHDYHSW